MKNPESTLHDAHVRFVRAEDVDALKSVIDSTGLFPAELLDAMVEPYLTGMVPAERWLTLVAGEPVGLAYAAPERMTEGTWNLYLIAVRADLQGQGHGGRLLAAVERMLGEAGERVLLVETSALPEFEATRSFYDRKDYRREAVIRDFYQAGEDKVVFWKALSRDG